jgi:hypothetical protein
MNELGSYRKSWNKRQSEFRRVLLRFDQHDKAIQLFLSQHAMLHSAKMAQTGPWSFEDEILDDITDAQVRRIPRGCNHSVAWCIWHIARIEDITMNLLVAGGSQILHRDNWLERMKVNVQNTGNAMDETGVADLSAAIDIDALRAYRLTVGRQTREIVSRLQPEALKQKVDPSRLGRVMDEEAVVEAARGVIDYWGHLTIAGLLLMPPTRHCFVHLNESLRLKQRR